MADTRYTLLRDLGRSELHLDTNDISDVLGLSLFRETLKIYSRFRGIRNVWTIALESDIADYTLESEIAHIIDIYWNDTYPGTVLTTTTSDTIADERYHNPSLAVIDALKQRLREKYQTTPEQEWQDYYSGEVHKVNLRPTPTTDIVVEGRKVFTEDTYPQNDEEAIKTMFKAKMLGYMIGIAQMKSVGDAHFNIEGMAKMKKDFEADFYNTLRTMRIVHK